MGNSSYGILCYGLKLEPDAEQPWDDEKYERDEDAWWREKNGFDPVNVDPFDDVGNYKEGFCEADPRVDAYFAEQNAWDKANPFPFEVRMIGHHDEAQYVLASKVLTAEWCECVEITPDALQLPPQWANGLLDFCAEHEVASVGKPGWWLTSFYG